MNTKDLARKLWLAAEIGDQISALQVLKDSDNESNQMSVNCTNSDGWAPLHVSASEGHSKLIEILIHYGAIIDARTKNFRTPLHIACIRGNYAVI